MKKLQMIILGIILIILAYLIILFFNSNNENKSTGLSDDKIKSLANLEVEEYCRELRMITSEDTGRESVCSGGRNFNINLLESRIEVYVIQRVVYGVSTNRGSINLKIVFDEEGNVISPLQRIG